MIRKRHFLYQLISQNYKLKLQIKVAPNTKNVLTKWYVTTALAMNQIQIKTIILSDLWSKGTYLSNIALVHKIHWALVGHGSKNHRHQPTKFALVSKNDKKLQTQLKVRKHWFLCKQLFDSFNRVMFPLLMIILPVLLFFRPIHQFSEIFKRKTNYSTSKHTYLKTCTKNTTIK